MKDKLVGDDAIIARTLEKVELAVRRASNTSSEAAFALDKLASNLAKIIRDMYE